MTQQKVKQLIWGLGYLACVNFAAWCPAATIPGDLNDDGVTNFQDAVTLSSNYGLASGATLSQGDLNSDGAVNFSDAFVLNANYSSSYATTSGTVGDAITSLTYDFATGVMTIETTAAQLNGVNLTSAGNLFIPGVANWIGENHFFSADTTSQQGYTSLSAFGSTFFTGNGYVIGAILPANVSQATLLADLTINYSVQGVAGVQTGDLIFIGGGQQTDNDTVITASPASIALGRVMQNTTPSDTITLDKTGAETTTYSATTSNDGVAVTASGSFAGGAQSENVAVELQNNANGSSTTGLKSFTVTVDNLATTSASTGQGSDDPNDTVDVSATVVANRVVTASGVNLGNVIVGANTASVDTSLTTTGDDDNFTRVTVGGGTTDGSASVAAGSQLFDDAADTLSLGVTGNFATAGAKVGNVALSVTGEGLAGEAPNAVNVAYSANAFDASQAQFDSNGATSLTLDFGNKLENSGSYNLAEAILNALATAGFTADLDFDSILSSSGDTSVLFTDITNNAFAALAAGDTFSFIATFDSNNAVGPYSATYEFGLSDGNSYQGAGAANSQVLTLTLQGNVVPIPEPSSALLLVLGALSVGAFRRRRTS